MNFISVLVIVLVRPRELQVFISIGDQEYSRTAVYYTKLRGEKQFIKMPNSWYQMALLIIRTKKFWGNNTQIIVGSPSHLAVPLLRILTKNRILFDAGWPLSDSTAAHNFNFYQKWKLFVIDFLAFNLAHLVAVETDEQKKFVHQRYFTPRNKLNVIFTGFNEINYLKACKNSLCPPELTPYLKDKRQIILFRGKYNLESGIDTIMEAASLLGGQVLVVIATNRYPHGMLNGNIVILKRRLNPDEIAWLFQNSKIVLGQMSLNRRLKKTIPHKFFEAAAFSKCYLTPAYGPLKRICSESEVVFIDNPTPDFLAKKIKEILKSDNVAKIYGENLRKLYDKTFSQEILCKQFELLSEISDTRKVRPN